jgi:uncharacterized protein (DUF1697 family)
MSDRYVALLRGINVGGKNLIPMAGLREAFTEAGARDVTSYIQSGNVLFEGDDDGDAWVRRLEQALAKRFDYHGRVTLRSDGQLRDIVASAPRGFGEDPATYRSDVLFLLGPSTATEVAAQIRTRDGVDTMDIGPGVIYHQRLIARATQSLLSKVIGTPVYQEMTIRNWRTTTTLLRMLDERAG